MDSWRQESNNRLASPTRRASPHHSARRHTTAIPPCARLTRRRQVAPAARSVTAGERLARRTALAIAALRFIPHLVNGTASSRRPKTPTGFNEHQTPRRKCSWQGHIHWAIDAVRKRRAAEPGILRKGGPGGKRTPSRTVL